MEITVAEMAEILSMRKHNGRSTILYLGARAGRLFRNLVLNGYIEKLGNVQLDGLNDTEKFHICCHLLSNHERFTQSNVHDILSASLINLQFRNEDTYIADLVKEKLFDIIISSNIDTVLEEAFLHKKMREPYDFRVFTPNNRYPDDIVRYKPNFCTLIKIYGGIETLQFTPVGDTFYLEDNQGLKAFLESALAQDVLVIGFDPIWDQAIERAFPTRGGDLWFVHEEQPTELAPLVQAIKRRSGKYLLGADGEYNKFISALHDRIVGNYQSYKDSESIRYNDQQKGSQDKFKGEQEPLMTQVDFAIITTRPDEFAAVLQRFPTEVRKGKGGRTYGISLVHTKAGENCWVAVVRSSEQGSDAAQQVANDVINDLDPQMLLVVGIAGGVPHDDFTLGDVIISTRIDNLNVSKRFEDGKEEFDIRGGIHPGISDIAASLLLYQKDLDGWNHSSSITVDRPGVDLQQFETDEFKEKIATGQKNASWYKKVRASITKNFKNEKNRFRPPLIETGTIASSNSLIRNTDIFVQWLQTARTILAVEMESAGVYQATQRIHQQYQVMAIRGISDIIGFERDDQWTKYACQTAAAFAYAFVTAGILTPRGNRVTSEGSTNIASTPSRVEVSTTRVQRENRAKEAEPIEIFISYSEDDEKFKKQLETHLAMLRREGTIRSWHGQQIEPGQEWEQETANHIDSARLILLLVSSSFLASDQLYENEMMRAMERQASGDARVIPIILRSVDLGQTPFSKLQPLPRNGKPVDTWRNADEIWSNIVQEIRQVCEKLRKSQDNY